MPTIETERSKVRRRLEREGWLIVRHGAEHDVYRHPAKPGTIVLPRHRVLSMGVARQIARVAGWI
jgi:predicted RNA binding protein YcfA (HicA-like mRNA interferase family)